MKMLECLRCGTQMNHIKREKIQLGQTGLFFGDWPNIIAGAMELDIYSCPNCGKVEFFIPKDCSADNSIPQRECPRCGRLHDFDYPKCPFCKHDYNGR